MMLFRDDCNAKVNQNVYGGGEIASVGRYWVNYLPPLPGAPEPPEGLPLGMPYETRSGGDCTVIVRDNAIIGSDGADDTGNVFGGGNAAPVEGSTHVNIGTTNSETYVTGDNASHEVKGVDIRGNVYGGGNKADVTGSTNVRIGKENSTPSPARETTGGEVTN